MTQADVNSIINEAQLEAMTEEAIAGFMDKLEIDRSRAISIMRFTSLNKEKVVAEIMDAGAKGGFNSMVNALRERLVIELKIQQLLDKLQ